MSALGKWRGRNAGVQLISPFYPVHDRPGHELVPYIESSAPPQREVCFLTDFKTSQTNNCGSLNEMSPINLRHLNICFPVGNWEELEGVTLLGEECHWALRFQVTPSETSLLHFLIVDQDVGSQLLFQGHAVHHGDHRH